MGSEIKAAFLDLSGVLYEAEERIEGSVEAVTKLRELDLTLRFVTNTATKTNHEILKKLRTLGFELADAENLPKAARLIDSIAELPDLLN